MDYEIGTPQMGTRLRAINSPKFAIFEHFENGSKWHLSNRGKMAVIKSGFESINVSHTARAFVAFSTEAVQIVHTRIVTTGWTK